jgi:mono/diheme cytochrome c family protein
MKPRAIVVLIAALSIASPALAGGSPAELYTLNCWGCHKPRAEGIPGTVPRLADSMADFLKVPGGREYLVEVPGVAASALTDAEVAQVLNWLLFTFNKAEMPADFKPISADEVKAERAKQLNAAAIHTERDSVIKELGNKAGK